MWQKMVFFWQKLGDWRPPILEGSDEAGGGEVAGVGGRVYLERHDDDFLQPILVYFPLLAHGSGIGGVGSSERLLSFS
jgi:hypothetical protein